MLLRTFCFVSCAQIAYLSDMKGQQRGPQQRGPVVGKEVSPMFVLIASVSFVLGVMLLHFYGKLVGGN